MKPRPYTVQLKKEFIEELKRWMQKNNIQIDHATRMFLLKSTGTIRNWFIGENLPVLVSGPSKKGADYFRKVMEEYDRKKATGTASTKTTSNGDAVIMKLSGRGMELEETISRAMAYEILSILK